MLYTSGVLIMNAAAESIDFREKQHQKLRELETELEGNTLDVFRDFINKGITYVELNTGGERLRYDFLNSPRSFIEFEKEFSHSSRYVLLGFINKEDRRKPYVLSK